MKIGTHSPVGASSAHRWMKCPASVPRSRGIRLPPSEPAIEGTRAHEAGAAWIESNRPPGGISVEMTNALLPYAEYLLKIKETLARGDVLLIEQMLHLRRIHESCWGTADAIHYDRSQRLLRVIDLKYGRGIFVDAIGNVQLLYYALGAAYQLAVPVDMVEMVIVQPRYDTRDGPVRTWTRSGLDLVDFAVTLREAVARTMVPDPPAVPGEWCRYCPAAASCPELREVAHEAARRDFSGSVPHSPEAIAAALDELEAIEAYVTAVKEFAYAEALRGERIPGWKIVEKYPRRKWKLHVTAESLSSEFGVRKDEVANEQLRTPNQVERILAPDRRDALRRHWVSESSGTVLVSASDSRPAVTNGNNPENDFERIEQE